MIANDLSPRPDEGRTQTISPDRGSTASNRSAHSISLAQTAVEFAQQSEKLAHQTSDEGAHADVAAEAMFVTPHDPVIITAEGHRLPGVPLQEAHKLNILREELEGDNPPTIHVQSDGKATKSLEVNHEQSSSSAESNIVNIQPVRNGKSIQKSGEGSLRRAMPPSHTNPLFPPLPLYGPPSLLRDLQCTLFRVSSFFLSLAFLAVIVLGALFTSIPLVCQRMWMRLTLRNPDKYRPFFREEMRRRHARQELERTWKRRRSQERAPEDKEGNSSDEEGYIPTEGGHDPIKCDVGYYARRVGLDVEEFQVQTEDGFIIDLWHVYDPREYTKLDEKERTDRGPDLFTGARKPVPTNPEQKPKFPVLLMHGLLQSSGAYCVNDEDSLAFYLCKSGYDVWLGNNRCGFKPKHVLLEYSDPRMWCWNIRQMGVFDLPALTSRILYETGFEKIGLICHSQGTTQALVALAKEQRPELGEKLTVFCALAPAAYAGPLIGKMYFKFMRVITPAMFRMMFGIHSFIPFMMSMHKLLPPRLYGWMGYKVFWFLFNWSDSRWDRGLRDRMFQFAPVYVSAESMRWWLGRECFARNKCILATREEWRAEEREDIEADSKEQNDKKADADMEETGDASPVPEPAIEAHRRKPKGSTAWYNEQAPPFALWICGKDDLVDGVRLLRRFERGREPHVKVVHQKVIPDFEHLDVIWAMDAPEQVFKELREVLWKTCNVRDQCRVPKGCEDVTAWSPDKSAEDEDEEAEQSSSSENLSS